MERPVWPHDHDVVGNETIFRRRRDKTFISDDVKYREGAIYE
jgi:hypothetical protein